MSSPPRLTALDYIAAVAKDWAANSFAGAEDTDFSLAPHRFDLDGSTVRRLTLPPTSEEAADPFTLAGSRREPTAWARCDTVTLIADCDDGESVVYRQEIVEVIAVEEDDIVAEAATVIRIPGLPPCLGRFSSVM